MTGATYLLIVTAEVDTEIEEDWNRWYDTVHLPDALACPGVLSGRRYCSIGESRSTDRGNSRQTDAKIYTTIYELAGPEAVTTPAFQAMRGWHRFAPHVRSQTRVIAAMS